MKKVIKIVTILVLVFYTVNGLCQSNVPELRLDSIFIWNSSHVSDSTNGSSYIAYTYNENDQLIKAESKHHTNTIPYTTLYSYKGDTIISMRFSRSNPGFVRRSTTINKPNLQVSNYEQKEDDVWKFQNRIYIFQNSFGQDSFFLNQVFQNEQWVDSERKEYQYNVENGLLAIRKTINYITNENADNKGDSTTLIKLNLYDELDRISSFQTIQLLNEDTLDFGSKFIYHYHQNGYLDSIASVRLYKEDGGQTEEELYSYLLFTYLLDSTVISTRFNLTENGFQESYLRKDFPSNGDYGLANDSVYIWKYNPEVNGHNSGSKYHFKYEQICNDKILYSEDVYFIDFRSDVFAKKSSKVRHWYSRKDLETQNVESLAPADFKLFPNPSKINEPFRIELKTPIQEELIVEIYNIQGKLISEGVCGRNDQFIAPNVAGIYVIVMYHNTKLWKSKILVVQ